MTAITDPISLIRGTCAACRHSRPARPDAASALRLWCAASMPDQSGANRGLVAPTFDRRVPHDYGCTFWQPSAAYTGTPPDLGEDRLHYASPQGDGHP
jgi:hypothetical protein